MSARTRTAGARYPLHELEQLIGWPTAAEMAADVGSTKAAVLQWRARGLSHRQADDLAIRFDYHPALVWPEWLDNERMPVTPLSGRPRPPARVRPAVGLGSPGELGDREAARRRVPA